MVDAGCLVNGFDGGGLFGDEAREVFVVEVKFDGMGGGDGL